MASLDLSSISYSEYRNLRAAARATTIHKGPISYYVPPASYYKAPTTTVVYKPASYTTTSYTKTTYYKPVTYSSYYYSGYVPVSYRTYIPLVITHPVTYWNVYNNRLPWGA